MKVLFLHDTSQDYLGGAELSNQKVIDAGKAFGMDIDYDQLKDFRALKESLPKYDLLIVSNIVLCKFEMELIDLILDSGIPYVKYEHDYGFCQLRNVYCFVNKDVGNCCNPNRYKAYSKLHANALLNVFLSELHYKIFRNEYGACVDKHLIFPSPIDVENIEDSAEKEDIVTFVGDLSFKKGGENLIEYAQENPNKKIQVFGEYQLQKERTENVLIKGKRSNAEVLKALSKSKYFFFKPVWLEPFGRVAAEAFLSGCKMLVNDRVGALTYDYFPKDKADAHEQIKNAPNLFWESILKELKSGTPEKKWENVLVFKSYGGLGDVFISLAAIHKLKAVSKNLTYAARFGLAPFFDQEIQDFKTIPHEKLEEIDFSEYDKVIDLANYPSFKSEHRTKHSLDYPTHNKVKQHAIKHYIDGVSRLHPVIDNSFDGFPYLEKKHSDNKYFTVHPGAGFLPKCWPEKYFEDLIISILEIYKNLECKIILGPEDPRGFTSNKFKDRIHLIEVPLNEVAEVLRRAQFHVGNDSGITHFSGLFNIPVVTIHGPSGPGTWASFSEQKKLIWGKKGNCNIYCNYHTASNCEHRNCLTNLMPYQVLSEVLELISESYEPEESTLSIKNPNMEIEKLTEGFSIKSDGQEFILNVNEREQEEFLEHISQNSPYGLHPEINDELYKLIEALAENKIVYNTVEFN